MTQRPAVFGLLCIALLGACQRTDTPTAMVPVVETPTLTRPAQAVQVLSRHLRDNDLQAFARDAVPAALHAQLEDAWREGRTRWPLQELPFDARLPALLANLSTHDAEQRLQRTFDEQFARRDGEIHGAVASLAVFGSQYLQDQGDFSGDERAHYTQLVLATSRWAGRAPLGDRERARQAIAQLTTAARQAKLGSPEAFSEIGMDRSLQRMGVFQAAFKAASRLYGLDLDAALDSVHASLQQQTGDIARVRMRYRLGEHDIDTLVTVQRIDGRWYLADYLRHARAAVAMTPVASRGP
jgi:hypothetical protein